MKVKLFTDKKIGHTRMNILRRIKGLRDWLGLHRGEKKEKECKRNKERKLFWSKFVQLIEEVWELLYFRSEAGARTPFFFMGMGN